MNFYGRDDDVSIASDDSDENELENDGENDVFQSYYRGLQALERYVGDDDDDDDDDDGDEYDGADQEEEEEEDGGGNVLRALSQFYSLQNDQTMSSHVDRGDGWSHLFLVTDQDQNTVMDIINDAVSIQCRDRYPGLVGFGFFPLEPQLSIEQWRKVGTTICRCKKMKEISFQGLNEYISVDVLRALFYTNGSPNISPLSCLRLGGNDFGLEGVRLLVPFLKTRSEMDDLDLSDSNLDDEGARLIADVLDAVLVKELFLARNNITVAGMSSILNSRYSTTLLHLDMNGNNFSGRPEIDIIARFLGRDGIALESIVIGGGDELESEGFQVEWVEILLRSLRNNSSLRQLSIFSNIHDYVLGSISTQLINEIINLTGNTSSFDALCNSNHTFASLNVTVDEESFEPTLHLRRLLKINNIRDISSNQRLRCKLQSFYFQEIFSVEPFLSMKVSMMPNVLELVTQPSDAQGKEVGICSKCVATLNGNLSDTYQFIRHWNVPLLFSFPPQLTECQKLEGEMKQMQFESNLKIKQLEDALRDAEQKMQLLELENKRLMSEIEGVNMNNGCYPHKQSKTVSK